MILETDALFQIHSPAVMVEDGKMGTTNLLEISLIDGKEPEQYFKDWFNTQIAFIGKDSLLFILRELLEQIDCERTFKKLDIQQEKPKQKWTDELVLEAIEHANYHTLAPTQVEILEAIAEIKKDNNIE
ncbi:MAG: hypothetical protein A2Z57_03325 [Planctomycetes bacterium RIFCSPHIGHO2_12_39_6]|nr:MAG: hypothetical protein A2Z57_03325 [Planctomycetes bacterium RIFCSPHIGHO2_12_39_6]